MPYKKLFVKRPIAGEKRSLELEVAIHPNDNGKIIMNYPGFNGDIDGFNNKYGKLADFLQEKNVGAVVRTANKYFKDLPYPESMIDNFKFVLDYAISHSKKICGAKNPQLNLMGVSAGASVISLIASDYSQIEKILLVAPSGDAGKQAIKKGLKGFTGELYITIGEDDEIVGSHAGQLFYDLAISAKSKQLIMIPNCDHQFRGEINGKIMSKAPLWAFAEDKSFPSPEGGIKLYD